MTTKRKIIIAVLFVLTLLFSFLAWWSVDRAVNVPESSTWLVPFVSFTILFIIYCLDVVVIRESWWTEVLIFFSLLISFIFGFSWLHLFVFLLVFLILMDAKSRIRKDLRMNIQVSIRKSIREGAFLVLIGLSLFITSQYYIQAKRADVKKIIPKLELSKSANQLFSSVLEKISPNFKKLNQNGITVDDLLLEIERSQGGKILQDAGIDPMNAPAELRQMSQNLMLEEGRKYFSNVAGFKVSGQEKVADVFLAIINKKVDDQFNTSMTAGDNTSILPAIMALVLLLTLLSIGAVADFWLILLASGFVWLLIKFKVLNISKVIKEVEVLE